MHKARKRFGQNFLQDQSVIDRIAASVRPKKDDFLVEIGPGQGALTDALLSYNGQLTVIELDRDLIPGLRVQFFNYPEFNIIESDALKVEFDKINPGKSIRVVGNLPYNISTPLIFHLLSFNDCVQDMHFMLQKEVVERIGAEPGTGQYGRLSVMTQYFCQTEYLFTVGPEAFLPAPKVESAIVRLVPHKEIPFKADNFDHFSAVVRQGFSMRRKTLRNNLKGLLNGEQIEALDIDPSRRPETITVEEWVKLANASKA